MISITIAALVSPVPDIAWNITILAGNNKSAKHNTLNGAIPASMMVGEFVNKLNMNSGKKVGMDKGIKMNTVAIKVIFWM